MPGPADNAEMRSVIIERPADNGPYGAKGIGEMTANAPIPAIANADPAACYPTAVLGLNATVRTDQRTIPGDAFFTGLFETALKPGELITAITFPIPTKAAYVKYKQPASRFALVGVFVSQGAGGVRVAVTGAKSCVFRAAPIEEALAKGFTPEAAKAVKMPTDGINSDMHGSAAYRAAMISVMASRAVAAALAR
jgi:carbon-monoxide dehydrogenase medium subunit